MTHTLTVSPARGIGRDLDRRPVLVFGRAGCSIDGGEYWIVNLGARAVEVYSSPDGDRYAEVRTLRAGDALRPAALVDVVMAVAEILPKV